MSRRTVLSIVAASAFGVAVMTGASAVAIAAALPTQGDLEPGGNQPVTASPTPRASESATATADPSAAGADTAAAASSTPACDPAAPDTSRNACWRVNGAKFPGDVPPTGPDAPGDRIRALVPGEKLITETQLRADLSPGSDQDPANTDIWVAEAMLDVKCMAGKGFFLDPRFHAKERPMTAEQQLAMWGDTGAGDSYHWQDAGCHGASVHALGQDDAH